MVFASISLKILYIKNKLFYNKYIDTKYFYPFSDGWCCLWLYGDSCMIEVVCPYKKRYYFNHNLLLYILNYEEDSQHFLVYSIS